MRRRVRAKLGMRLLAFVGTLASFALIVRQGHRPGDFQSGIVGLGVALATFSAILGIMQSRGAGRVEVLGLPADDRVVQWANSHRGLLMSLVIGIGIAIVGIWNPASF
jgi:hypothetical protein